MESFILATIRSLRKALCKFDDFGSDADIPNGKEIINLLFVPLETLDDKAKNVTRHFILAFTLFGKEVDVYRMHLPANLSYDTFSYEVLKQLLEEKKMQNRKVFWWP